MKWSIRDHIKNWTTSPKPRLYQKKEEAIIWEQEHRLALKRGDPSLNLTKDKFADIATA